MGWLTYHREPGENNMTHFQRELFANTDYDILTCATIRLEAFYAAVRTKSTGQVWALIVLIRHQRGRHNFGYKVLDENVDLGVSWADAPATVLDALTPTDNETAPLWRERCGVNLAKRAETLARKHAVRAGVIIELSRTARFPQNRTASRFECVHRRGDDVLWNAIPDNGPRFLCRLTSRWADLCPWTIITPAPGETNTLPGIGEPAAGES